MQWRWLGVMLLVTLASRSAAQTPEYPRFEGEIDLGAYVLNTRPARGAATRGTNAFLFGEVSGALHLDPRLSLHTTIHIEPLGSQDPRGGTIGVRREGAYVEALNAEFRPAEGLTLVVGKYVVPFGRGHGDFPGVVALFRAHETYLFNEALGVMARATLPLDAEHGEHTLSAAAFTRDRTVLSTLLVGNRTRCCSPGYDRYARNTAADGGPGNTGRLNNGALALDGERIAALPGFAYHAALLTRGQGQGGTAREFGQVVGLRQAIAWDEGLETLLFAEAVRFQNARGSPIEAIDPIPGNPSRAVAERRRFATLAAQTTYGDWRATIAWQQDARKRSANSLATQQFLEVTGGRVLGAGFTLDAGWQFATLARDNGTGARGQGPIALLRYRADF